MTSPRALFLSLAATVCAFAFALVVIISQASQAATPVVASAHTPSTVAVVAQELSHDETVAWTVVWKPVASR
jgi:hypothetical protein